jgi:hypothetical protein
MVLLLFTLPWRVGDVREAHERGTDCAKISPLLSRR